MSNKNFSDVRPNRTDKNTKKDASYPTGSAKPGNPGSGSFEGPNHKRGGTPTKGGKGLPCPDFKEHEHFQPSAPLPKDGK